MSYSHGAKCDVLIVSATYGAGHIQVSNALKQGLKSRCPDCRIKIYDYFSFLDPTLKKFFQFSYIQMLKHFSKGWEWYYTATKYIVPNSKWQRFINKMGEKKLLKVIKNTSPDVIVCTFPTPAGVVSTLKQDNEIDIPLVTIITDITTHNQWVHKYVDAYIVGASIVARNLKRNGISNDNIHVTGIPLRQEFEKTINDPSIWTRYNLHKNIFTILLMGGGNGLMTGIDELCTKLNGIDMPFQVIAITGTNKALAKKLERLKEKCKNPIHVLGYVDDTAQLMEISDVLVGKAGGITIFEAMAKSLPMIIYNPLPGHEMSNTKFLLRKKAAIVAKDENDVIKYIEELMKYPKCLDNMKLAMESIAKPLATQHAVDIILKLMEEHKCSSKQKTTTY
ncbi:MAG: glycosyltransferase [Xylanivirga thermophila]|uniref:MGDG synthase family glycosyltransferase n=1 Tax=Xylanivirga thermophila TaxID=2496273 RepID=UPI0039F62BBE